MPSIIRLRARSGVTLLELAIVIVVMGVAGSIVTAMVQTGRLQPLKDTGPAGAIVEARRLAVRRAEPVRLRVSEQGAWTITSLRDGVVIDSGTARSLRSVVDLQIDALGVCVPTQRIASDTAFDPMQCATAERAR